MGDCCFEIESSNLASASMASWLNEAFGFSTVNMISSGRDFGFRFRTVLADVDAAD
jgi:hypothetical protein